MTVRKEQERGEVQSMPCHGLLFSSRLRTDHALSIAKFTVDLHALIGYVLTKVSPASHRIAPGLPASITTRHLSIEDIVPRAPTLHKADTVVEILLISVRYHYTSLTSRFNASVTVCQLISVASSAHPLQTTSISFISSAFAWKTQCRGPALAQLKPFAGECGERKGEMFSILCFSLPRFSRPSSFIALLLHFASAII